MYEALRGTAASLLVFVSRCQLSLPPQVMINNGFTPDKEDYEFCTKVDNMIIPTEGFFGISAATGGLAGMILLSVSEELTWLLLSPVCLVVIRLKHKVYKSSGVNRLHP